MSTRQFSCSRSLTGWLVLIHLLSSLPFAWNTWVWSWTHPKQVFLPQKKVLSLGALGWELRSERHSRRTFSMRVLGLMIASFKAVPFAVSLQLTFCLPGKNRLLLLFHSCYCPIKQRNFLSGWFTTPALRSGKPFLPYHWCFCNRHRSVRLRSSAPIPNSLTF